MKKSFIISGAGGQGVLSIGVLLATLAMEQGYEVSYFPSYGPEMRGGTAHCHVVISDAPIASPRISSNLTYLVAMNQPSWDRFASILASDGKIIANASLVHAPQLDVALPMQEMALELGNLKVINMIAFGAMCKELGMFDLDKTLAFIDHKFKSKPQFQALNRLAFMKGYEASH